MNETDPGVLQVRWLSDPELVSVACARGQGEAVIDAVVRGPGPNGHLAVKIEGAEGITVVSRLNAVIAAEWSPDAAG